MIQEAFSKVLEGIRKRSSAAGGRFRGIRMPLAVPRSGHMGCPGDAGSRPALAAWAFAGAAVAAACIFLYLRKRRQVAAHYRMGEGDAVPEGGAVFASREREAARP